MESVIHKKQTVATDFVRDNVPTATDELHGNVNNTA